MRPVARNAALVAASTAVFAGWTAFGVGGPAATRAFAESSEVAAAALAAWACARRARRDPDNRRPWWLLAASAASWAAGAAVWTYEDVVGGRELPFPSVADVGFLLAVPFALLAFLLLRTTPMPSSRRWRMVLDGLAVACSLAFVSWALLLGPLFESASTSTLEQALSVAYPIADVVIITVIVLLLPFVTGGPTRRRLTVVGAGLTLVALADSLFAYATQAGTYLGADVVDTGWFAGFLLVALGAWLPVPEGDEVDTPAPGAGQSLFFPYLPGALVLVVVGVFVRVPHDAFLVVDGLLLLGLLLVRQFLTLVENRYLTRQLQAKVEAGTARLHEREARFAALFRRSSDVVSIVDVDGAVRYQSPSIHAVLGRLPDAVVGTRLLAMVHPDDRRAWDNALARSVARRGATVSLLWRLQHVDGTWRWLETTVSNLLDEPSVDGLVLNSRDVTERAALEEQLRHSAFHDPLTGLANRALFRNRVEHALAAGTRHGRTVAVLFVDLDEFKGVNDGHGHAVGDAVLVEVARILTATVRAADTVASLGGDEFAVLLEDGDNEAEVVRTAKRILDAIQVPITVEGRTITVRASIGIATALVAGDADDLVRNADVAMYAAKSDGKACVRVFRPEMREQLLERLRFEAELWHVLENDELVVEYQPIVDIDSEAVVAVEALLRWHHPQRGIVPPGAFIPVVEASGLIVPIGAWLLRKTCREVVGWRTPDGRPVDLSVNISPRQLAEDSLVDDVVDALAASGLEPHRLTLEITESILLDDADRKIERLRRLKAVGVKLSIDDFGTGYSSLAYLNRLPVDELKVDRSFLLDLDATGDNGGLVRTILSLARDYGLRTVAEGIERPEQLMRLRLLGCHRGQGFLFAKPMPARLMRSRLAQGAGTRMSGATSA
jgi:diguanylate cyclase (GGDEF)-like protein/PAS domain S-box-containing protein